MKKVIIFCALLFCTATIAKTINWYVDGSVYQTTTCNSGDSVTPPTPPAKYGYTFREWRGYTPIEYIGFTGTQKITIPVAGLQNYARSQIGFRPTASPSVMCIIGLNNGNVWLLLNRNATTFNIYSAGDCMNTGSLISVGVLSDVDMLVTGYSRTSTLNDVSRTCSHSINLATVNSVVLACNPYQPLNGEVYYYKLFNNADNLLIDAIPVLDKDGVPCMYDKISGTCFYNTGTGNFIVGPVVNN